MPRPLNMMINPDKYDIRKYLENGSFTYEKRQMAYNQYYKVKF